MKVGTYQAIEQIWTKGNADLVKALNPEGNPVAMWRFVPQDHLLSFVADDENFQRASKALYDLSSPNLRAPLELGFDPAERLIWCVTPLLTGRTLQARLLDPGPQDADVRRLEASAKKIIEALGPAADALSFKPRDIISLHLPEIGRIETFAIDPQKWLNQWAKFGGPQAEPDAQAEFASLIAELAAQLPGFRTSAAVSTANNKLHSASSRRQTTSSTPSTQQLTAATQQLATPLQQASGSSSTPLKSAQPASPLRLVAVISVLVLLASIAVFLLSNQSKPSDSPPTNAAQASRPAPSRTDQASSQPTNDSPPTLLGLNDSEVPLKIDTVIAATDKLKLTSFHNQWVTVTGQLTSIEKHPQGSLLKFLNPVAGDPIIDAIVLEPPVSVLSSIVGQDIELPAKVLRVDGNLYAVCTSWRWPKVRKASLTTRPPAQLTSQLSPPTAQPPKSPTPVDFIDQGEPTPTITNIDEFGRNLGQQVTITGTVEAVETSQSGKTGYLLFKQSRPQFGGAVFFRAAENDIDQGWLQSLIGQEISISGIAELEDRSNRHIVHFTKKSDLLKTNADDDNDQ